MKVNYYEINSSVRTNFIKFYLLSLGGVTFPLLNQHQLRDEVLKQFNCIRVVEDDMLYYQFSSDADYTMFVLRFS